MLSRIRAALAEKDKSDKGFTLIELLVVVIIIGILAAIAIPVFMNQKAKAYDASVKSDLKSFATGAETTAIDQGAYVADKATFATQGYAAGVTPISSKGNTYEAYFVTQSGAITGYVIMGKSKNSSNVFVLSSFNGSSPDKVVAPANANDLPNGTGSTKATAPAAGAYGIPAGATVSTYAAALGWSGP